MIDVYSKMTSEQRLEVESALHGLGVFLGIIRMFPNSEIPAEVSVALKDSADQAARYVVDLCALLTGMSAKQRQIMLDSLDEGLTFEEMMDSMVAQILQTGADA